MYAQGYRAHEAYGWYLLVFLLYKALSKTTDVEGYSITVEGRCTLGARGHTVAPLR